MDSLASKYSSFYQTTAVSGEVPILRLESKIDHLRILAGSPKPDFQALEQYILETEATGLSIQDLYDNSLMVFSPLSTDYLTACLLHRFARLYLTLECFRIKPIILDGYLKPVAIPEVSRDNPWMTGVDRIEAFVENNYSFGTLRATQRTIRGFHP